MAKKFWIDDLDGFDNGGRRQVTAAELRAEIDAAIAKCQPVVDAVRRGDLAGVEAAQKALRAK